MSGCVSAHLGRNEADTCSDKAEPELRLARRPERREVQRLRRFHKETSWEGNPIAFGDSSQTRASEWIAQPLRDP